MDPKASYFIDEEKDTPKEEKDTQVQSNWRTQD